MKKYLVAATFTQEGNRFLSPMIFDSYLEARRFVSNLNLREDIRIQKKYPSVPKNVVEKVFEVASANSVFPICEYVWIGYNDQVIMTYQISVFKI